MMRSLFSAVAGLRTHQTKMDVIGNNIANVNTYGFKASRVTFSDVYYQTTSGGTSPTNVNGTRTGGVNPTQIGYGAQVATIDVLNGPTGASTTNRPLDVYLTGEGYLTSKKGDEVFYTRLGNLKFDVSGNLVDHTGNIIQGFEMQPAGQVVQKTVPVANSAFDPATKMIRDLLPGLSSSQSTAQFTAMLNAIEGNISSLKDTAAGTAVQAIVDNLRAAASAMDTSLTPAQIADVVNAQGAIDTALGTAQTPTIPSTIPNPDYDAAVEAIRALLPTLTGSLGKSQADMTTALDDIEAHISSIADAATQSSIQTLVNDLRTAIGTMNDPLDAADATVFDTAHGALGALLGTAQDPTVPTTIPNPDYDAAVEELRALLSSLDNPSGKTLGNISMALDTLLAKAAAISDPTRRNDVQNLINGLRAQLGNPVSTAGAAAAIDSALGAEVPSTMPSIVPARDPANPLTWSMTLTDPNAEYTETDISNISLGPDVNVLSLLTNINVDKNGRITGTLSKDYISAKYGVQFFANETYTIGQLAMANFGNAEGLMQAGNSYYKIGPNSGDAGYVVPGKNGTGELKAGFLEMSNVDISQEFTDMITTQRGFQANTRIITVSDEMLQELVNLKR